MNATHFLEAARRNRAALVAQWERRFAASLAAESAAKVALPAGMVERGFDDFLETFAAEAATYLPHRHLARRFAELVDFPACTSLCIRFYLAGAQVIGAYIAENAGPRALWSRSTRNQLLGELDAVFHVLTHQVIEELGRMLFDDFPRRESFTLPLTTRPNLATPQKIGLRN